jgi:hypothetical protein
MNGCFSLLIFTLCAALGGCAATAGEDAAAVEQGVTEDRSENDERAPARTDDEAPPTARDGVPTFDEIRPILADTCSGCHRPTAFATIDKVKYAREEMLRRLSVGAMPQGDPTWSCFP